MNDEDHVLLSEKWEDQLKAVEWAREQNGWNPDTHWNHPKKGCFSSRIQKKVGRYVPFSLFCISLSS